MISRLLSPFIAMTVLLPVWLGLGTSGCAHCKESACIAKLDIALKEPLKESGRYVFTVTNTQTNESAVCELDFDGNSVGNCRGSQNVMVRGSAARGIDELWLIEVDWSEVAVEIERDGDAVRSATGKPTYSINAPEGECVSCKQGALSI